MAVKKCSKCGVVKSVSEFHKNKSAKDGYKCSCKECRNREKRIYNLNNKDKRQEYNKLYNKKYYNDNKEREKQKRKDYYKENREDCLRYAKKYREENRDVVNKRSTLHKLRKRRADSLEYFKHRIRNNIYIGFKNKNYKKGNKTRDILGCTFSFFREYIESKFTDGMNFDNLSKIHLDHIIPLSTAKNKEDVIRLCHYTNYQPLWAEDNILKSNKIYEDIQLTLL